MTLRTRVADTRRDPDIDHPGVTSVAVSHSAAPGRGDQVGGGGGGKETKKQTDGQTRGYQVRWYVRCCARKSGGLARAKRTRTKRHEARGKSVASRNLCASRRDADRVRPRRRLPFPAFPTPPPLSLSPVRFSFSSRGADKTHVETPGTAPRVQRVMRKSRSRGSCLDSFNLHKHVLIDCPDQIVRALLLLRPVNFTAGPRIIVKP